MESTRVVLVINARFIPQEEHDAYPVGAMGFSLSIARLLKARGLLAGILLYARDETLSTPSLTRRHVFGFDAMTFHFNYSMPLNSLRDQFVKALYKLANGSSMVISSREMGRRLVVYYQTPTLLYIHPDGVPFLVTHHGPFVADIIRNFGYSFALEAFAGGAEKVAHLLAFQERGISILKTCPMGMAIEISHIQKATLLREGVASDQLVVSYPPVGTETRSNIGAAKGAAHCSRLQIISATARVDSFKNLEELVKAANLLWNSGLPVNLKLHVGHPSEDAARCRLKEMLNPDPRRCAHIGPRLRHGHLLEMFEHYKDAAIFVCCSKYETFGITPLEAAMHGMVTIVPDRESTVGIAGMMPGACRYRPNPDGLAEAVAQICDLEDLTPISIAQKDHLTGHLTTRSFVDDITESVASLVK